MSWMLFIDESGHDRNSSPYEVLAGVAIEDKKLWQLIRALSDAQVQYFGFPLFEVYGAEAKAVKLLKSKVFKKAAELPPLPPKKRNALTKELLNDGGENLTYEKLVALNQSKIAYVKFALDLCSAYDAKAFASIVPKEAKRPKTDLLRKDYVYLFERFYNFLEKRRGSPMGYLVFDEIEKSASHILLNQVSNYFIKSSDGRKRAKLIIPEPLFVHSDMTTMVQMADLVAYIISWGMRLPTMSEPARNEFQSSSLIAGVMKIRFTQKTGITERRLRFGYKLIKSLE